MRGSRVRADHAARARRCATTETPAAREAPAPPEAPEAPTSPAAIVRDLRGTKLVANPSVSQRGSSLLETIAATVVAILLLGGAAEQARSACATVRDARTVTSALTAARNVLDIALATPCASVETATSACTTGLRCTIASREVGRRTGEAGTVILLHLTVDVSTESGGLDAERLARLVGVAARPEVCA